MTLKLRRIEPVVTVADRVAVRLEEARLLVTHALTLTVDKAGLYALELTPQPGLVVSDVRGEGVEDWKATAGKLMVTFNTRILGTRRLEVQLEQALKLPEKITVTALRVTGATRETAQIAATPTAGIQLKTATDALVGAREIPVDRLGGRSGDEALAFNAEQADWKLMLTAERLAARITAEVFNLVTIGDGLLGGSATIRYGLLNQGVQEFRVKVPARWKNVEFTGPNIRRKELTGDTWVIGLQEKAWGGYTLVVTYDQQFDPHEAELIIGGLDCAGVERQTGTIAVTSAASLQIQAKSGAAQATPSPAGPALVLDRIDEAELAGPDRALITRPVLLGYRFVGGDCVLSLAVTRFEELPVLDAAADRTQLTTVLTADGQLLTQASFMVKNNDRQFQTFTLPADAKLWSCYLDNAPVKPERNDGKLLVPLPRRANRDVAFAVDLVYAQKIAALNSQWLAPLALVAPATDMQTTYAEWELYAPGNYRLDNFAGTMTVARGTTYGLRDAWLELCRFYDMLWQHAAPLTFGFGVCLLLAAGIVLAVRRGWSGLLAALAVLVVFALLAGMLLPALSSARGKARRTQSMNNLKQIGLGLSMFADQHGGQLPGTLDELKGIVGSERVFTDAESGEEFTYVGTGYKWQHRAGEAVLAYSPTERDGRNVLFSDGHVEWISEARFADAMRRTVVGSEKEVDQFAALRDFDYSGPTVGGGGGTPGKGPGGIPIAAGRTGGASGNSLVVNGGVVAGNGVTLTNGGALTVSGTVSGFNTMTVTNAAAWGSVVVGSGAGGVALVTGSGERWSAGLTIGNGSSNNSVTVASATVAGSSGAGFNTYNGGGFGALAKPSSMAAGIRPLRIDIPKTGQRFVFTKVLNVRGESLNIHALALEQDVYRIVRGTAQALALVAGLALVVWQWRRARPCSLTLTVGLALTLGAVVSFLLAYRLLHVAMILAVPVGGIAVGVWVVRKLWKRRKTEDRRTTDSPPIPPVLTAIVVLLLASATVKAGTYAKRCETMPATASGRSFGTVTAGMTYRFSASGCIKRNSNPVGHGGIFDNPDGVEYLDADCSALCPLSDCGSGAGGAGFAFPKQRGFSLVGKIAGSAAVQLGTSGKFTAPISGELVLFFNDDNYGDNSGTFDVCVWEEAGEAVSPVVTARKEATRPVVASSAASPDVSILSARYTGTVRALDAKEAARAGQFEAVIELNTTRDNQTVRLFGEEIAVEEFTATPATVQLVRDGSSIAALVPRKGPATVRVKYLVKPTGDVARRQVVFGIPAALVSRLAVTIDEPEAQVEVPPAISFKTTPAGQQTLVEAVFGNTDRVELNWTPRLKRMAEIATTVFCQNTALVNFGGGVVNVRARLDYQITQGELRQLRVAIPVGQRLMRVEGDALRTWKLDGQTLNVELIKGVTPSYRLTVETEKVMMEKADGGRLKDETAVGVEIPHALEVKRETGLVALKAADELSVSVTAQQDLQKVDVDEFTRVADGAGVASAFRFLKPDFKLAVHVEPVQPQIEAVVRNHARVTTEQLGLLAVVDYTIKRAGVFTLKLAVPTGYRVERVTGPKIAQWVEKTGLLDVTLKERTTGAYNLSVELVKPLSALPKSLVITGVQPLGTSKLSGFVSVAAEEGVQVKSESFDGLTEVPAALIGGVPSGGSVLGFKLITGEQPVWKLAVATEKIESWVRAEVCNTVTLSETLVSGRSVVRYEIQNAPTKEFRVRVPANFRNVEVTGANIRRKDHDELSGEWRLELQNKVRGTYAVTVTWDRPWDVKSGALEVTGVEAPAVEREIGWVVIAAPARLEVKKQAVTGDLLPADARDLPDWAGRPADAPVLVYRYLRPGFKLGVTTQRFEEAEVLQALIDNVRLVTVVAEDGQMMTEMTLAVRNNARQYLEIALPPGTTNVWSAFVAGQPVRPCVRAGKLLVPMERSSGDAPVTVEVTYVGSGQFPPGRGSVALESPALDVPLKDARWELYLPPDYTYSEFAGSMQRAAAVAAGRSTATLAGAVAQTAAPVVKSYALSDYRLEESRKQVAKNRETETILSNARRQLDAGDLNGANMSWNMARGKGVAQDKAEFKRLEKDIKQGQANQLIVANGGQSLGTQGGMQILVGGTLQTSGQVSNIGGGTANNRAPLQQAAEQLQYDEDAAEQQVAKVQAAQEVTVAKTVPLRLNLPKRGVYLAFAQVLQTEPGKPMTVDFNASNDRSTSLPIQLAAGVVGLAALWLVVKLVLRKQN